jgi:hypothetical protein
MGRGQLLPARAAVEPAMSFFSGNPAERRILGDSLASVRITDLFDFLSQYIGVSDDLRIQGCDGSLRLTGAWFEKNHIEAGSGLEWIKAHGPNCNCDCEIFSTLQEQLARQVLANE